MISIEFDQAVIECMDTGTVVPVPKVGSTIFWITPGDSVDDGRTGAGVYYFPATGLFFKKEMKSSGFTALEPPFAVTMIEDIPVVHSGNLLYGENKETVMVLSSKLDWETSDNNDVITIQK